MKTTIVKTLFAAGAAAMMTVAAGAAPHCSSRNRHVQAEAIRLWLCWSPYLTAADFPGELDWIGDAAGSILFDPTEESEDRVYWNANRIHAVGYAKRPNAFGLYDCYDNIRELCRDAAASGATYGEKYAFNLDTRTGVRTVATAEDILPIAYSGSDWGLYAGTADVRATYEMMYEDYVGGGAGDGVKRWLPTTNYGAGSYVLRVNSTAAGAEELSAEFDCQFAVSPDSFFDGWAAAQGLTGDDAAWDAKPALWGGEWANAFIYTYGEGLADGTLAIMEIGFDSDAKPVITTTPVVEGHTDFTPAVIGSPSVEVWTSPVVLENNSGDDWTLPAGAEANFFRVQLSE